MTFRPIKGNKHSTLFCQKEVKDGPIISQRRDLKPTCSALSGMDITPLCTHSSLMNCFNKVIFLRFCNEFKFHILSRDGKILGIHSVSKSQFCQKVDIIPVCCQPLACCCNIYGENKKLEQSEVKYTQIATKPYKTTVGLLVAK